jgi:hypothetical protein
MVPRPMYMVPFRVRVRDVVELPCPTSWVIRENWMRNQGLEQRSSRALPAMRSQSTRQ